MNKSKVTYKADGTTKAFTVSMPYLRQKHIIVEVNGVQKPYRWLNDTKIELATAPVSGAFVTIFRQTPTEPLYKVENNRPIPAFYINELTQQAIYVGEENRGEQGVKGDKGDKGDRGIQGIQGVQGIKGDKGDKGDRGLQGIQGIKGDKGDKGDRCLQGIQGIKGDKGDKGDRGLQGIQGVKGDKGDRGLQGIKGDKGDKGEQGLISETYVQNLIEHDIKRIIAEQEERVQKALTDINRRLRQSFTAPDIELKYTQSGSIEWPKDIRDESLVELWAWGGGGGGAGHYSGGGGGGECVIRRFLKKELKDFEDFTIGKGGAGGQTDSYTGSSGGDTSLGRGNTYVLARGGDGGTAYAGGLGGGAFSGREKRYEPGDNATYGGGGGGGSDNYRTGFKGGNSIYGGGGGGGGGGTSRTSGAGGTSIYAGKGGNGGSPNVTGYVGAFPAGGGGGGGGGSGAFGGDGANGMILVKIWY